MSRHGLSYAPLTVTAHHLRPLAAAAGRELVVLLFFLVLAVFATRPLVAHLETRTLGYTDPFVDLWTIDWLSEHFFEPSLIFQGNTYDPEPHAVLYSDLSLGTVVLLLPLRLLIDDPVPLYNLAVLLALAFGGWAFHALTRDLTRSRSAGLVAGILSAFSAHQLFHVYHLNLLTIGWLALFLLGLFRILRRPTVWASLLTGVAFALNAQSSGYYALAAVLLALLFAAVYGRGLWGRRQFLGIAGAAIVAAMLTLPYVVSYMGLRAQERLHRPISMSERMSFFAEKDLGHDGYLYRWLLRFDGEQLFPGLLTLILGASALARRRFHITPCPPSPVSRLPSPAAFFSLGALACLVFSLGPYARIGSFTIPLPYLWLHEVPPFDGLRHPNTFAGVAVFMAAVIAGLGWAGLRASRRRWAGAIVVSCAIVETAAPPRILQSAPLGLPLSYQMLRGFPRAPILEIPLYAEETLLWAARHGLPTVNGQGSAFVPLRIRSLEAMISNQWLRGTPRSIDDTKPARRLHEMYERLYVIIPASRKPELAALADAFRDSALFAPLAVLADGDRVFTLERPPLPRPPSSTTGAP